MHKLVKQSLLRYGGYGVARALYNRVTNASLRRLTDRVRGSGAPPLPDQVMLEPTQRCNMRCSMCWQDRAEMASASELPVERFIAFFEANPGIRKATLIGGEPFVRADTLDLLRYLDRRCDLVICTNGTLLDDERCAAIASLRRVRSVCISLEGPREIHETIRPSPGCFDKAAAAIRALAPHVPVCVNAVIQDANILAMDELVDLCAKLGARKLKLELERLHTPECIKATQDALGVRSSEIPSTSRGRSRGYPLSILKEKLDAAIRRGRRRGIYVYPDPPYLMENIATCHESNLRTRRKACLCQKFRVATITPDGSLVHCLNIRKPFGNIATEPLSGIWHSPAMREFRTRLLRNNLAPICEGCPFLVPE